MKTISELNSKWWYRFSKVIYLFFFAIVLVVPPILNFEEHRPLIDTQKSTINCKEGVVFSPQEVGIFVYDKNIQSADDNKIRIICLSNSELGEIAKRAYPNAYNDINNEDLGKRIKEKRDVLLNKLEINDKNYTFNPVYSSRNWAAIIVSSLLAIFIYAIILEVVRRIFYYIVLGSLFPKKKNEGNNLS